MAYRQDNGGLQMGEITWPADGEIAHGSQMMRHQVAYRQDNGGLQMGEITWPADGEIAHGSQMRS